MKNMNYPQAGELHRRAGRQAALLDWPVGCTLRGASGLHIKLGCRKGRSGRLPAPPFFSARRTAFLCSPPARPSVLSSVQPADSSRFYLETWPSSLPVPSAFQLVLSSCNCSIKWSQRHMTNLHTKNGVRSTAHISGLFSKQKHSWLG